jgi:enterobactin synthetase component D
VFIQSHFSFAYSDNPQWLQGVLFSKTHYNDKLFVEYNLDLPDPIAEAMPKRKAEFLAGRLTARKACDDYLATPFLGQLAIGPDRAPIWPIGLNGSISHCYLSNGDGIAIAACCSSEQFIGIDVEAIFSGLQAVKLANLFTDHSEREVIASMKAEIEYLVGLTAVFSAKESFFKAAYPDVQRYFDFDAIKLIGIKGNRLYFNLMTDLSERFKMNDIVEADLISVSSAYLITMVAINL